MKRKKLKFKTINNNNHFWAPIPSTPASFLAKLQRHKKPQKSFLWSLFPACGCVLLLTKLSVFVGAWGISFTKVPCKNKLYIWFGNKRNKTTLIYTNKMKPVSFVASIIYSATTH